MAELGHVDAIVFTAGVGECSGNLSIEQLTEKSKRLPIIKEELEEKEMRWLELSEIDG